MAGLTEQRQRMFAKELFRDFDPGAAYERAGYRAKAPATRQAAVAQLLRNINVQRYLREEYAKVQERLDVQQDRAVLELCRLAYSDLRQVASWGPDGLFLKESSELPEDVAATVQDVQCVKKTRTWVEDKTPVTEEETRTKVKLHPKPQALKLLQDFFRWGDPLSAEAEAKIRALLLIMAQYVPRERLAAFRAHVYAACGIELPAGGSPTDGTTDAGTLPAARTD